MSSVLGLKARPQRAKVTPREIGTEVLPQAGHELVFLAVVDPLHRMEQRGITANLAGGVDQRLDVLGEAGAAIAAAGIDEVMADARVGAYALAHGFDVGPELLRQGGHLVHEGDLGGQHGVGCVLGQLGAAGIHLYDAIPIAVEGGIELFEQGDGVGRVCAYDDAIRPQAVGHRGPLLEKLRVGDHLEGQVDPAIAQDGGDMLAHPVCGADRHCALVDHHLAALHQPPYGAGHRQYVLQIGRAVFIRRGADRDEDELGERHPLGDICGELQATGLMVGLHQGGEAGLEDGDHPLFEALDLGGIHVHAGYPVAHLGEHRGLNQPHITYPEYADSHLLSLRSLWQVGHFRTIPACWQRDSPGFSGALQAGFSLRGGGRDIFWCKGCNAALTRTISAHSIPYL